MNSCDNKLFSITKMQKKNSIKTALLIEKNEKNVSNFIGLQHKECDKQCICLPFRAFESISVP